MDSWLDHYQLALRIGATIAALALIGAGVIMIVLGVLWSILPMWIVGAAAILVGLIAFIWSIHYWIKSCLPKILQ